MATVLLMIRGAPLHRVDVLRKNLIFLCVLWRSLPIKSNEFYNRCVLFRRGSQLIGDFCPHTQRHIAPVHPPNGHDA
jgi:hypothetical protein